MNPIIKQLYTGKPAFASRPIPPEPSKELYTLGVLLDQLIEAQGFDFAKELSEASTALNQKTEEEAFQAGFLLGGKVILALYNED